ncbi:hypothetical protein BIFADO_00258 [Bifidobacterium adolescentis L2-32]|uniref:Uncharacterized protein n=1 Tax=Bifidobacterium adolescentis L2-32 TaxID=411481 RepID=A7A368_BIFAD|nr:hypothetical protein BIFADO_00258 [Bifidobacterium adolescentis L2-32]
MNTMKLGKTRQTAHPQHVSKSRVRIAQQSRESNF